MKYYIAVILRTKYFAEVLNTMHISVAWSNILAFITISLVNR